jgi:hypothetical protein
LKFAFYILVFMCSGFSQNLHSQTVPFKENMKWGIKENEHVIIKPVYDTIFNFDNAGKICLACFKAKALSPNRFIKTYTINYSCNYLNRQGDRLKIKTDEADTCSVFSLGKNTIKQYNDNINYFVAFSKNKKYLVAKDLNQSIFKGYSEIYVSPESKFIITEIKNEANITYSGLINFKQELIVPYLYSGIKVNPIDSLIVGCSAGVGNNGDDDIYDYNGKKLASYKRHIDMATKNFVIYKIFEPKEYYILFNPKTKEESTFTAEELTPFARDEVLLKAKNEWFTFNLTTKQKKPYKK